MPHKTAEARRAWRKRHYADNPDKYERDLRVAREAKQRRTGTCERCGAVTRYNGHRGPVSRFCAKCGADIGREANDRRRGTGPRQQQVLALLDSGPKRYSELRAGVGVSNDNMGMLLSRLLRYGLIVRTSRGVYEHGER